MIVPDAIICRPCNRYIPTLNSKTPMLTLCPKFIYRLTSCPELSLGLYSTTTHLPDEKAQAAYEAARAPDSSSSKHKTVLLAHVIATLTTSESVTDASMDFPSTFPSHPKYNKASTREGASTGDAPTSDGNPPPVPSKNPPTPPAKSGLPRSDQHSEAPGHHPAGRTIAIHSVAVLPPYQGLGLGKIIMKAYLQRMEGSGIADRAVLIAHPEKVGWYVATFGFQDKGDSKVQHAGGNWKQLVSCRST